MKNNRNWKPCTDGINEPDVSVSAEVALRSNVSLSADRLGLRGFGQLNVHPNDARIQIPMGILRCDFWQGISLRLFGDHGEGLPIAARSNLDADQFRTRLDHDVIAYLRLKYQCLHPDKGIITDFGRPMHLRLMRQGAPITDVDGVFRSADFHLVFK